MTFVLASVALTVLLMLASASDIRARRVPNLLNAVVVSGGLLFQVLSPRAGDGWSSALGGLAVGFGIWFPMYLFRLVGAGDVKLFAAAAVWIGPRDAVVLVAQACEWAVVEVLAPGAVSWADIAAEVAHLEARRGALLAEIDRLRGAQ